MASKRVARVGDLVMCPAMKGSTPHVCGVIIEGSDIHELDGKAMARVGDKVRCACGDTHKITTGTDFYNNDGKPVATEGSKIEGGGKIVICTSNYWIEDGELDTEPLQPPMEELIELAISKVGSTKSKNAVAEAIGELGLIMFQNYFSIFTHPDFRVRYHGPDGIAQMKTADGEVVMFGLEAKGTKKDGKAINEHKDGKKQQSEEANLKRALLMEKKDYENDKGNRKGGRHTEAEVKLYEKIAEAGGEKILMSTHTNTETGEVTMVMRDEYGEVLHIFGQFTIPDFEEKKAAIYKKLRG